MNTSNFTIKEADFKTQGKCLMYIIKNSNKNIFRFVVENDKIYINTRANNKTVDKEIIDFLTYEILNYPKKWSWGSFTDDLYSILNSNKNLVEKIIHPESDEWERDSTGKSVYESESEDYDETVEVTFETLDSKKVSYRKSVKNNKQINLKQDLQDIIYLIQQYNPRKKD